MQKVRTYFLTDEHGQMIRNLKGDFYFSVDYAKTLIDACGLIRENNQKIVNIYFGTSNIHNVDTPIQFNSLDTSKATFFLAITSENPILQQGA